MQVSEGAGPCQHLDLGPQAFGTVRPSGSVVLSHPVWVVIVLGFCLFCVCAMVAPGI